MEKNHYTSKQLFMAWVFNKIILLSIGVPWLLVWWVLFQYSIKNLGWYGVPVMMLASLASAYLIMTPWLFIQKKMKQSKSDIFNMMAYEEMNAQERAAYKP